MQVFIYYKFTVRVSGVHRTHHQEYIKLHLQPLVQVILRISATTFLQCGLIRPRWRKVVALKRDITCTRGCRCIFMYS